MEKYDFFTVMMKLGHYQHTTGMVKQTVCAKFGIQVDSIIIRLETAAGRLLLVMQN